MKHLVVHKDLLTKKSYVFDRMFNGGFKEATTNSATFPDDDPDAFEKLIEWLYTGRFLTINSDRSDTSIRPGILSEIAQLANKYSIWELLDRATTGFVQFFKIRNFVPALDHISSSYEKFPPGSKMRLFHAKCAAWVILNFPNDVGGTCWRNAKIKNVFEEHTDLMLNVLDQIRNLSGKILPDPRNAGHCEYHEHAKADVCPWSWTGAHPARGTWEA